MGYLRKYGRDYLFSQNKKATPYKVSSRCFDFAQNLINFLKNLKFEHSLKYLKYLNYRKIMYMRRIIENDIISNFYHNSYTCLICIQKEK